jgi:hypothetical protein
LGRFSSPAGLIWFDLVGFDLIRLDWTRLGGVVELAHRWPTGQFEAIPHHPDMFERL